MAKQRSHNEWFRSVSLGGRKSCPSCGVKLNGEKVWSWGEYVRAKWHTVLHFCKACFQDRVKGPLTDHVGGCGCDVVLRGQGESLPDWLTLG